MKKCPKCIKIYDDSWDVCLVCGGRLLSANLNDAQEFKKYDKIIKCDSCGNDISEKKSIKYLVDLRKGVGALYKIVCKECSEKIGIRKHFMMFFIIFVLAIPLLLLIIAFIFDRSLFNQMLSSTSWKGGR